MKAAILKTWNTLELENIEKPIPSENEALVKIIYGGVCGSDITVYNGLHPTATAPVVLCHEILGTIEYLPSQYKGTLNIGDRVLMNPVISCGNCKACKSDYANVCYNLKLLGIHANGGFAEYTVVSTDKLVAVDETLTNKVAVLGEPFAVAYHVNKRAGIKEKDFVFISGAGPIGIVVGLVAKHIGASVVISEINQDRINLAKQFGFDTLNPSESNILDEMKKLTNNIGFDVVIDASGAKSCILALPDLCRVRGTILSLGLAGIPYEIPIGKISFKEQNIIGSRLYSQEDFEAGIAVMSKINNSLPLEKLVTNEMPLDKIIDAIELMKNGGNIGKIIIRCEEEKPVPNS